MLSRIRQLLAPPVFEDEEKTRVARLLNTVLLSFLAVMLLSLPVLLAVSEYPLTVIEIFTLLSVVLVAAMAAGLWVAGHRGHLRGASLVLLTLLWTIMAFWMCAMSGLRGSVSVPVFCLIIVLAGLLMGGRAAVVFTGLSVLAIVAAFGLEVSKQITVQIEPVSGLHVLFFGIPVILTGVLLRYAMNSMIGAMARARRNEQAQIRANRELQQIRASLEERVAARTRDLAHRSAQTEAAVDVSRTLMSILDTDRLAWQVVDLIRDRFHLYHVGLFMVDPTNRWAVYRAGSGAGGQELLQQGFKLAVGGTSLIGWCAASGQVRVAQDVGLESGRVDHGLVPNTRSEAALPLLARGRVTGALSVQSSETNAFDPHTLSALEIIAEQLAVALDNTRLFAESQEALEAARRAYGERSREAWTELAQRRASWGYVFSHEAVSPAAGEWAAEMQRAAREGITVAGDDPDGSAQRGQAGAPREVAQAQSARLAVPIQVRGQVVGVLGFEKATAEGWTSEEKEMLEGLAVQTGAALESAQLFAETQTRAAQEQILAQVTARIRESLDIEAVLKSAAREVRLAVNAPEVIVQLVSPTGHEPSGEASSAGGNGHTREA